MPKNSLCIGFITGMSNGDEGISYLDVELSRPAKGESWLDLDARLERTEEAIKEICLDALQKAGYAVTDRHLEDQKKREERNKKRRDARRK